MKLHFVFISFLVGFLSLGEEIAWVRIVGFMGHSVPQAFSFVLFCYIAGIAVGALIGPNFVKFKYSPLVIIAALLFVSGVIVTSSPILIRLLSNNPFLILLCSLLIFTGAACKGAVFPLVHHWFTEPGKNLGRSLSWVYFANVMGSAFGPILVGFLLLDMFSMFSVQIILGLAELILAICLLFFISRATAVILFFIVGFSGLPLLLNSGGLLKGILNRSFSEENEITHIIENRHGVIYTVKFGSKGPDTVYGGNVYDGKFSVDFVNNSNGIERAFLLAAMQPHPKKVLFIGLSSGSWLRVVAAMPGVDTIDVVEINKGYAELISYYHGANDIFNDKRIKVLYTDGRQLVQKAVDNNEKYDLIVMNTTWHWRAYTTNLLSIEFMGMLKKIMGSGAVLAFNATHSPDVFYTAYNVFDKTYMHGSFVYASDHDLNSGLRENKSRLCQLEPDRLENQNCNQPQYLEAVNQLIDSALIDGNQLFKTPTGGRPPEILTDDNMIIEYRYGAGFSMQ